MDQEDKLIDRTSPIGEDLPGRLVISEPKTDARAVIPEKGGTVKLVWNAIPYAKEYRLAVSIGYQGLVHAVVPAPRTESLLRFRPLQNGKTRVDFVPSGGKGFVDTAALPLEQLGAVAVVNVTVQADFDNGGGTASPPKKFMVLAGSETPSEPIPLGVSRLDPRTGAPKNKDTVFIELDPIAPLPEAIDLSEYEKSHGWNSPEVVWENVNFFTLESEPNDKLPSRQFAEVYTPDYAYDTHLGGYLVVRVRLSGSTRWQRIAVVLE